MSLQNVEGLNAGLTTNKYLRKILKYQLRKYLFFSKQSSCHDCVCLREYAITAYTWGACRGGGGRLEGLKLGGGR